MKRMVWILVAAGAAVVTAGGAPAGLQQSTPEIMQRKLDKTQQLLRALVLAEFEGIETGGSELDSLAEFQSWFVLPTPEYARHTEEFREAAQGVARAGHERDIAAATEAYTSVVRKCVQCHEYMRRVR